MIGRGSAARAAVVGVALGVAVHAAPASAKVLQVGTYKGVAGQYSSIQDAVNAAQAGDWVLVAPGDYRERADYNGGVPGGGRAGGGVWIAKGGVHVRGMDRNGVIVDGTKSGPPCSSALGDQDLSGPPALNGAGRNGVEVYKADGVSVENLTTCNFLGSGNQIWFNGGDGSGKVGIGSFHASYLSATTTYYDQSGRGPAGTYGIFVSNAGDSSGPSSIEHSYASNMNDSAYYIGACPDCNTVLSDAHGEYSALGYSGTNSGGRLLVQNSEFDNNQDGFDTNSQNNDDAPSPQDGGCPAGVTNPNPQPNVQRGGSCWIFTHNYVHDNNNANVPAAGSAAAGPVGTGMSIAGGRHNVVTDNVFAHNNAWGLILVPYPDTENPPAVANCRGGVAHASAAGNTLCYFDDFGNEIANNKFIDNGGYGNPSNGDIGELSSPNTDGNCAHDNTAYASQYDYQHGTTRPLTSDPAAIQTTHGNCSLPSAGNSSPVFTAEVSCDSQLLFACPQVPGVNYPRQGTVVLGPMPTHEPSMPNPCDGVPANTWCTSGQPIA